MKGFFRRALPGEQRLGQTPATAEPGTIAKGKEAEQLCGRFLALQGYKLLQSNFCCKGGEIDLVLKNRGKIVFVEVRFRKSDRYGSGAATVTRSKQSRIIRAAHIYLKQQAGLRVDDTAMRFDVIEVSPDGKNPTTSDTISFENHRLRWIKNAFAA